MWEKHPTLKKNGRRFFTVSPEIAPSLIEEGYSLNSELVLECSIKEEKEVKARLSDLTMEFLKDDTIEVLSSIIRIEDGSIQGSDEWKLQRLQGIVTGSNTPFMANGKPIPTFNNYCSTKAMELFYHAHANTREKLHIDWSDDPMGFGSYKSTAMKRGNELEEYALNKWVERNPQWVVQTKGLVIAKGLGVGVSVDAIAFNVHTLAEKIIEIKSPALRTFTEYLINPNHAKSKYKGQTNIQMMVMGIYEVELVIYYPDQSLIRLHYKLDMEFAINALQTLKKFRGTVAFMVNKLIENREED